MRRWLNHTGAAGWQQHCSRPQIAVQQCHEVLALRQSVQKTAVVPPQQNTWPQDPAHLQNMVDNVALSKASIGYDGSERVQMEVKQRAKYTYEGEQLLKWQWRCVPETA